MTGIWTLMAAVCAAEAMWLKQWRPVRVPADLAPAGRVRELPLPLVLEMLSVAIRQGSSIPRALIAVGAQTNMLDENGNFPQIEKPFLVDAVGTVVGLSLIHI